ncbi:hypothetical protein Btru_057887 [Bulinus truncatus]|nr:hypothetical protein Btru_057887 [Bulinus truncatus]
MVGERETVEGGGGVEEERFGMDEHNSNCFYLGQPDIMSSWKSSFFAAQAVSNIFLNNIVFFSVAPCLATSCPVLYQKINGEILATFVIWTNNLNVQIKEKHSDMNWTQRSCVRNTPVMQHNTCTFITIERQWYIIERSCVRNTPVMQHNTCTSITIERQWYIIERSCVRNTPVMQHNTCTSITIERQWYIIVPEHPWCSTVPEHPWQQNAGSRHSTCAPIPRSLDQHPNTTSLCNDVISNPNLTT